MSHQEGFRSLDGDPWTITRRGTVIVVAVSAHRLFDPMLVDRLDLALRHEVTDADDLVLDLTRVRFISSAMLGRLVILWMAAQKRGRQVILSGVTGTLAEILRIAGLHQRMQMHADVPSALAALADRAS